MFVGQIFVKSAKNDPGTLFERPKSDRILKSKKAEIPGNSVKNGRFRPSKCPNSVIFSRYLLESLHTYTSNQVLLHVFRLFKNSKIYYGTF